MIILKVFETFDLEFTQRGKLFFRKKLSRCKRSQLLK